MLNALKKTKLYLQEEEDDHFEGKDELQILTELLDNIGCSCDAEAFISAEESIDVHVGYKLRSLQSQLEESHTGANP